MECLDRVDVPKQQSKILFDLIQELLKPFGIENKEITEIAVGQGPGSYTGLRMGITVAKVWAYAQGTKLYTFSSSDLLQKTKKQNASARFPQVRYLEEGDFQGVSSINDLQPLYENDHFAHP